MELAKKLILQQFDEVFRVYSEWFDGDDHVKAIPRDKNISFGAVAAPNWLRQMQFIVRVNDDTVVFHSYCVGASHTRSSIDLGGKTATYGELVDILSTITTEIHHQLTQYAVANNFPPENVMH